MTDGPELLIAGALMSAALVASLLAGRLRIPALLLFLVLGMMAGSDGFGWVEFDDYRVARDIGIIALILIVVDGGLSTGIGRIRAVLPAALSLATLGTLVTAVVTGFAASLLFEFSLLESMLLGSIVASTDAAAIFGVLRGSTLRRKVARTLEGEAGLNDPVAILLVLGFIEWIEAPDYGGVDLAVAVIAKLTLGLVIGASAGWLAVRAFRRLHLDASGLYPVASVSAAAVVYGAAETLGGSGFFAVYLVALALGSADIPGKQAIIAFHEGLGWISQLVLFLTLGLLVFPSELPGVAIEGTLLGLVLAFVARPIAVFIVTAPFSYTFAERLLLSWAGLRGAVPVVLATFAVLAGVEQSLEFFNIVFFSVLISAFLQGATFEIVAERLGLTTSERAVPRPLLEVGAIRRLGAEVLEHTIDEGDAVVGARIRDLGLPREALVSAIVRSQRVLAPRGSTQILAGDSLHILVPRGFAHELARLVERWREGPIEGDRRSRLPFKARSPIFSVRPWRDADGNPARPRRVAGEEVVGLLRNRHDRPGALVLLEDGRYAVTGEILIVGSANQLQRYIRDYLRRTGEEEALSWWQEVFGALAVEGMLPPRAPDT